MSTYKPASLFDKVFEGGLLLKGASGVIELLSGLALIFVTPERLHHFITFITQQELVQDPHDKLANLLLNGTQHFGQGNRLFLIIYLWIHAAVKLIAVIGILRNHLWAYLFSLISLGILMLYQVYSILFIKVSIGMILLTLFDIFILFMIWREYGKVRTSLGKPKESGTTS